MKIFTCEKCGTSIKLHFIKGYVHLRCPACGAEYQLDTGSLKKIYAHTPAVRCGGGWYQLAISAGKNN